MSLMLVFVGSPGEELTGVIADEQLVEDDTPVFRRGGREVLRPAAGARVVVRELRLAREERAGTALFWKTARALCSR
jgi:hypothetical protein